MEYLSAIGITLLISTIIALVWGKLITNVREKYPDCKGEDFLNWGDDTHQKAGAGRDGWDIVEVDDDWYPNETL
jgi:hypothetical protein